FFLPQLVTDSNGAVLFRFTLPESLTTWKWLTLAHTPEGAFGYAERRILATRPFMVLPHSPRFFREGDSIAFSATIVSREARAISGLARLRITDPLDGRSLDSLFGHDSRDIPFQLLAGGQQIVRFRLAVPAGFL